MLSSVRFFPLAFFALALCSLPSSVLPSAPSSSPPPSPIAQGTWPLASRVLVLGLRSCVLGLGLGSFGLGSFGLGSFGLGSFGLGSIGLGAFGFGSWILVLGLRLGSWSRVLGLLMLGLGSWSWGLVPLLSCEFTPLFILPGDLVAFLQTMDSADYSSASIKDASSSISMACREATDGDIALGYRESVRRFLKSLRIHEPVGM
jgi:hypothetical protein